MGCICTKPDDGDVVKAGQTPWEMDKTSGAVDAAADAVQGAVAGAAEAAQEAVGGAAAAAKATAAGAADAAEEAAGDAADAANAATKDVSDAVDNAAVEVERVVSEEAMIPGETREASGSKKQKKTDLESGESKGDYAEAGEDADQMLSGDSKKKKKKKTEEGEEEEGGEDLTIGDRKKSKKNKKKKKDRSDRTGDLQPSFADKREPNVKPQMVRAESKQEQALRDALKAQSSGIPKSAMLALLEVSEEDKTAYNDSVDAPKHKEPLRETGIVPPAPPPPPAMAMPRSVSMKEPPPPPPATAPAS